MRVRIFVEGGGSSSSSKRICRQAFTALLKRCRFSAHDVQIDVTACGGRGKAFRQFQIAHRAAHRNEYVAMLVDSEDPVINVERTWDHLRKRDGWSKTRDSANEHVMLMTTSMETWIAADRDALRERYGRHLRENSLPSLVDLENRVREDVLRALQNATNNRYKKGEESFTVLRKLNPVTLEQYLPSFRRVQRVLSDKLTRP